jgi:Flp pilus assembly pilin Flp
VTAIEYGLIAALVGVVMATAGRCRSVMGKASSTKIGTS